MDNEKVMELKKATGAASEGGMSQSCMCGGTHVLVP